MGCFTANSNSFITRPWEAQGIFSYSILQPISRIFVEISGKKIMRILPYVDANEWISNKSRFQEKELIYIYPQMCVSVLASTFNLIHARIITNVNKLLFAFKSAMQIFLISFISKKVFGLILNAYVDVKEASNIRSLESLSSKINLKIYLIN
jgi:hypothetical protein